jgi:flagellar export protein FliJ
MNDRRTRRLELLHRLREMDVEQARAEHVAAQAELEKRRESVEDTQRRIAALDQWSVEQLSRGAPLAPDLLRQAALFRGAEQGVLEQQRAAQTEQSEHTEAARGVLTHRFEELSVVERLAERHAQTMTHEQLRRAFIELDEAGTQRMNLEAKE